MNKPLLYAKIYGFLLIIISILAIISLIILADRGITLPTNPFQSSSEVTLPYPPALILLSDLIAIITGYLLIKSKLYGVYALIALTILKLLFWLQKPSITPELVISIALVIYFYSQRKIFKK